MAPPRNTVPTVSVIIPTCNRPDMLVRSPGSVDEALEHWRAIERKEGGTASADREPAVGHLRRYLTV